MKWIVEREVTVIRAYEVEASSMEEALCADLHAEVVDEIEMKSSAVGAVQKSKWKPRERKKRASRAAVRGTRLPADFVCDIEYAVQLGIHRRRAENEAARFRDYWAAQPGQKGVKMDWPATWRNWCRSTAERMGAVPVPSVGHSTGAIAMSVDQWRRVIDLSRKTGNWNPEYGPPVGSPGCRVPVEALQSSMFEGRP